jgi:thioredoxin 1
MPNAISSVHDDTFDAEILTCGVPVLVDFWAEWCGPCRALKPILDEIAEIYGADLKVVTVDVESSPIVAERFAARAIPLLVLFDRGEERGRVVGALSKTRLCHFIDSHL